jgi:hypothetical protein
VAVLCSSESMCLLQTSSIANTSQLTFLSVQYTPNCTTEQMPSPVSSKKKNCTTAHVVPVLHYLQDASEGKSMKHALLISPVDSTQRIVHSSGGYASFIFCPVQHAMIAVERQANINVRVYLVLLSQYLPGTQLLGRPAPTTQVSSPYPSLDRKLIRGHFLLRPVIGFGLVPTSLAPRTDLPMFRPVTFFLPALLGIVLPVVTKRNSHFSGVSLPGWPARPPCLPTVFSHETLLPNSSSRGTCL